MTTPRPPFDALVLAGGRARRLDGASKPDVLVGGRRLLDRVLDAVAGAGRTVVVGPPGLAPPPVLCVQEDPPWGGPVAGLEAGLRALARATDEPARATDAPAGPAGGGIPALVLVLACDTPLVAPLVTALLAEAGAAVSAGQDGAWVVDTGRRPQPLVGAYRRGFLEAALARAHAAGGTRDASVRRLLEGARLRHVPDAVGQAADADTWDDVARLDERLRARED
ncbi:molybdenum cofactor guanylyltransferase [Cellulomonas fimi]|uniref:NTP transferase domain-containing protein n=1 Tax=Cellulomonas fimi TaxID=1708 RepID=A0A7Y0QHK7_CELFI|nr:NTP transferase domain-containing protein [Cellulomonas fimi]NMR21286.1 NTP transferase domain-containing protein [Cellulomonas fimi]